MDEQEREREVERQAQHEAEAGQMGGAAEAHAGAGAYPVAVPIAALMGSVRWGATVAGIAIAFAVTMVLIALGAGFGLRMGLAGFGGLDAPLGVQPVGQGDVDDLDLGISQQLLI